MFIILLVMVVLFIALFVITSSAAVTSTEVVLSDDAVASSVTVASDNAIASDDAVTSDDTYALGFDFDYDLDFSFDLPAYTGARPFVVDIYKDVPEGMKVLEVGKKRSTFAVYTYSSAFQEKIVDHAELERIERRISKGVSAGTLRYYTYVPVKTGVSVFHEKVEVEYEEFYLDYQPKGMRKAISYSLDYNDRSDGFNRTEMSRSKNNHSRNTKEGKIKRVKPSWKNYEEEEFDEFELFFEA